MAVVGDGKTVGVRRKGAGWLPGSRRLPVPRAAAAWAAGIRQRASDLKMPC